jgi:hypothetical protein
MQEPQSYLDRIREVIRSQRWAVQAVSAEVPFAYTVGLTQRGLPELAIAGLPPELCMQLLNRLATRMVDEGLELQDGAKVDKIAQGFAVTVHEVDADVAQEVFRVAGSMYGTVKAWQVFWPDAQGLFEGEEGFDAKFRGRQRLLQPDDLS